jgi:hypothetical protein
LSPDEAAGVGSSASVAADIDVVAVYRDIDRVEVRYAGLWSSIARQFRAIGGTARHLHEIEHAGEDAETPFIALLGVFLFVLPFFFFLLGIALLASWVAS